MGWVWVLALVVAWLALGSISRGLRARRDAPDWMRRSAAGASSEVGGRGGEDGCVQDPHQVGDGGAGLDAGATQEAGRRRGDELGAG